MPLKDPIARSEYDKRFHKEHREHYSQLRMRWRQEHPEKDRATSRRHSRKFKLKYRYGLSIEDFEKMLQRQKDRCAICFIAFEESGKNRPSVDHNHATNKVRGLLCHGCNIALGGFRDSVYNLRSAINYLKIYG